MVFVCAFVGTSGEFDGKPEVGRHVNFVDDVRSTLRQGKCASFNMPWYEEIAQFQLAEHWSLSLDIS